MDRSLGRHTVPDAIRAQGHAVHTLWTVYGESEQSLSDVEFLRDAGRNGWAVLTADMRIRWVRDELAAVQNWQVQLFALPRGGLTAQEQASRFVRNLGRILAACERPGPCIYAVHADRIERKWPTSRSDGGAGA